MKCFQILQGNRPFASIDHLTFKFLKYKNLARNKMSWYTNLFFSLHHQSGDFCGQLIVPMALHFK